MDLNLLARYLQNLGWQYEGDDSLSRQYDFMINGYRLVGTVNVDLLNSTFQEGDIGPRIDLRWTGEQGHQDHPHARHDGRLCIMFNPLPTIGEPGVVEAMMATAITSAPMQFEPGSLANDEWTRCDECSEAWHYFVRQVRQCRCGAWVCSVCDCSRCEEVETEEEEVETEEEEVETEEEEVEDDRNRIVLVGAGVTGSWVAPVLGKVGYVIVYDPDVIDDNRGGLWLSRDGPKVYALTIYGGYAGRREAVRPEHCDDADLIVVCADHAQVRRMLATCGKPILDIRATPHGLVVWALRAGETTEAYLRSLDGYPNVQPCGHHDAVPMTAGTAAAAFVAWWLSAGRPVGVWHVPFGFEGVAL